MKSALHAAILLAGFVFLPAARAADAASLPVEVSPTDAAIHYSGRFDMRDSTAPRCQWPASAVTVRFSGTALNVKLVDSGDDLWQVEIDGKQVSKLELTVDTQIYEVASGLPPGEHIVKLTKATEGFCGITKFLGFQLDAGAKPLVPNVRKQTMLRRIEVIGDSISCGYGVEAADGNAQFTPRTENAALAYGALAAQTLGADYTCIAFSGRKMWPDNTIPELYDRTLTTDPALKWDFTSWTPDAVIINLGTNDFGRYNPAEAPWIDAYRKFIAHVRANYPKALIYCTTGPMLGDDSARNTKSTLLGYVRKIVAAENAAGDANVRALDFGQQDPANGLGANWHPSRKTHQLMAAKLVDTLRQNLGWK